MITIVWYFLNCDISTDCDNSRFICCGEVLCYGLGSHEPERIPPVVVAAMVEDT